MHCLICLAVKPSDKGRLLLYIHIAFMVWLSAVPSDKNDLVVADVVQQFIPRWWPFNVYFSLYVHAVLTLEQSKSGGGLQCCWQTCLSSMLRNTGASLSWCQSELHQRLPPPKAWTSSPALLQVVLLGCTCTSGRLHPREIGPHHQPFSKFCC